MALSNLNHIYVPHGIEISRELALNANEKIKPRGGHVVNDSAIQGLYKFPSNFFTGILLSSFLEHEINPKLLLVEAFRTLAPDGHCIIKVPNFSSLNRIIRGRNWCGFRLPDHVNYFVPSSLMSMCKESGFKIAKFTIADYFPTSDNMWIVIKK